MATFSLVFPKNILLPVRKPQAGKRKPERLRLAAAKMFCQSLQFTPHRSPAIALFESQT